MKMWSTLLKNNFYQAVLMAVLAFFSLTPAQAQTAEGGFGCGTDHVWEERMHNDPAARASWERFEEKVQYGGSAFKDEDVRIIPVVFHIVHTYGPENISKQRILDQLQTLNENFRAQNADLSLVSPEFKDRISDMNVEFRLATIDPDGNCTDGITRTYSTLTEEARNNVKSVIRWDNRKYLNVWVVSSIQNFGNEGTVLGFAQFPFDNNDLYDGIVMRADQVTAGNRTLTHEVGHYLGLYHTFESFSGTECGANCNYTGDRVCDTPPTDEPNFGCPTRNSCTMDFPDYGDMVENYMDYSSCAHMFTAGQKSRVDAAFLNSKRADLITASNLQATGTQTIKTEPAYCQPVADFFSKETVVCQNMDVNFFSNVSNAEVTTYEWTFPSGQPATSSAANPVVKFTQPGTYAVTLKVSNPNASDQVVKQSYIKVLSAEAETKAPLQVDFDNFNTDDFTFTAGSNGLKWNKTSAAATSGSVSLMLANKGGQANESYSFTLPPIDMTKSSDYTLTYNYAYARQTTQSFDELRVEVSNNCGTSYSAIYNQLGANLATTNEMYTGNFVPTEMEWKKATIDLKSFKNTPGLYIRFTMKNRGGNNIYIDDINVGNFTSGIETADADNGGMTVYPNPSGGDFNLSLNGTTVSNATLEVYDMAGRRLQTLQNLRLGDGAAPLTLSREQLNIPAAGMYYLKVSNTDRTWNTRIIVTQ